jgi:hypothetical protein
MKRPKPESRVDVVCELKLDTREFRAGLRECRKTADRLGKQIKQLLKLQNRLTLEAKR